MQYLEKIQDDITIVLKAQKNVVHETVRVNVTINAKVDPSEDEQSFRKTVNQTLKSFIDTEWKIQSVNRYKDVGKYEKVIVQATARVSEIENHHLTERANELSTASFELVNPTVDYALTFDEIQAVNQELRLKLFQQAIEECNSYNAAMVKGSEFRHGNFRVASSEFSTGDYPDSANSMKNAIRNTAYAATIAVAAGGMNYQDDDVADEGSSDLNVSTRFSMTGTFTLRAVRE